MTIAANFPSIRPSLNLDFANSKTLDPRITFGRASNASFYDGKTVAKAEENLLTFSQAYSGAAWFKTNVSASDNSATAPDGTSTASTITASSGAGGHRLYRTSEISVAGQPVVYSVHAKAGTSGWLCMSAADVNTGDKFAFFDLVNGVVGTTASGVTASITPVGNGWHRCVCIVANPTGTRPSMQFGPTTADNTSSFTAAGTETILAWGAQLEQRSQVTAYTPTTTQPITNYVPVLQTAAANVARFDHNPVTGESLGLLIEEKRTNLFTRSEELDNANWIKARANLGAGVISPLGSTCPKFIPTVENNTHLFSRAYATSSGTYTLSIYVKAAEYKKFRFYLNDSVTGDSYVVVDLGSKTITGGANGSWTGSSFSLVELSNGWFRVSVTGTQNAGTSITGIFMLYDNAASNFSGDGFSGIYFTGLQLEAGAFPTSYIKTEASQVTRAADPNLAAALGQAGAGSIYVDATVRSGNTLATSGATTFAATASTRQKTAVAYDAASTRKSINGAAVTSSAGTQGGGSISIAPGATGWINKLAVYPQKASDAQLQALTA